MATCKKIVLLLTCFFILQGSALTKAIGQTYTNPILHEDYSDPDVIRVGNKFYMTASSFTSVPGLPILSSTDLVHWQLVNYALPQNVPVDYYQNVQHGAGVWAPSIRFHKGEFYIYYPDPDFGIYVVKAKDPLGVWSKPALVLAGKGLIDPCPLWDDNGKVYLVHAYAGSRAGIKSVLAMKEMNASGTKIINEGKLIYDGHGIDPTVEGPKLYKRNGWYYVFAPAGGVATGWQIVLRSKNIYGPYERKVVMEQGKTEVNGPHQGAWVQTPKGTDWFIHFQDKGAYGRITHLQPMVWKQDWPVIGADPDGDGIGNPVSSYALPVSSTHEAFSQQVFQDFQWNANPAPHWRMAYENKYRNYAVVKTDAVNNLWNFPAMYLRKIYAEKFTAVTEINFNALQIGERAGFILFGKSYAALELNNTANGLQLNYVVADKADKGNAEIITPILQNAPSHLFLKLQMDTGGLTHFYYSLEGTEYKAIDHHFVASPGVWVGAKMGFYCASLKPTNDAGYVEIKNFTIQK